MTSFILPFEAFTQKVLARKSAKLWRLYRSQSAKAVHYQLRCDTPPYAHESTPEALIRELQAWLQEKSEPSDAQGSGGLPVLFTTSSKAFKDTVFSFILNCDCQRKAMETFFFHYPRVTTFDELLERCANEREHPRMKQLLSVVLQYMSEHPSSNVLQAQPFRVQLEQLEKFSFEHDELGMVHQFFARHQALLTTKGFMLESLVVSFLKSSIEPRDWHLFSSYCPENSALQYTPPNQEALIGSMEQPICSMSLNKLRLKTLYPFMATDSDMERMTQVVLETFSRKGSGIDVMHGFLSFVQADKMGLHFMGGQAMNQDFIERMIPSMIDKYAAKFKNNEFINHAFMDKVFDAACLESKLDEKGPQAPLRKI